VVRVRPACLLAARRSLAAPVSCLGLEAFCPCPLVSGLGSEALRPGLPEGLEGDLSLGQVEPSVILERQDKSERYIFRWLIPQRVPFR